MTTGQRSARQLSRLPRREDAFRVPRPVPDEPGRFLVDATWGTINPIEIAPGVRTAGELEVIAHIEAGLPLVDCRRPESFAKSTIPSARSIPQTTMTGGAEEFDPGTDTVLFCNGPQCAATPQAIRALLDAGHPPQRLLYYRGGMHDWVTLGLPTEPGTA